ncbi:hypothetical protein D3C77_237710 [compost metagenome]
MNVLADGLEHFIQPILIHVRFWDPNTRHTGGMGEQMLHRDRIPWGAAEFRYEVGNIGGQRELSPFDCRQGQDINERLC